MFLELAEKQGRFENRVTYHASVHMSRQCCGAAIKKIPRTALVRRGQLNSASGAYFAPDTASKLNIDH